MENKQLLIETFWEVRYLSARREGGKEEETKLLLCLTYDKVQNFLDRIIWANSPECGYMFLIN